MLLSWIKHTKESKEQKRYPQNPTKVEQVGKKYLWLENKICLLEKNFLCTPYFKIVCFPLRNCGKHLYKMSLEGYPILQCTVLQTFWATDVKRYSMVFSLPQVDVVWQRLPLFSFLTFYQEWVEGQEFLPDSFAQCSHSTPSHPK